MNSVSRVLAIIGILLCAALVYGGYRFHLLYEEFRSFANDADAKVAALEQALGETAKTNQVLTSSLTAEQERNSGFFDQIETLRTTVGILDTLSKTDEELLEKYSKVYFLNEHYVPDSLSQIDPLYTYPEGSIEEFHGRALPYLEDLIEEAQEDGIELRIISAFRSFGTQGTLKSAYTVRYGSGANAFSADQGFSEHQLGTAVDFTTEALGSQFTEFEDTKAYQWLKMHAHTYGFVLSYPEKNTYYVFEPWHWRFVGTTLARDLNETGEYFYDRDQRDIDEYLVTIFD